MEIVNNKKYQYCQAVCNFQKYFCSNDAKLHKDFIRDLKENIEKSVEYSKQDLMNYCGHRLYQGTDSYIYYPKKIITGKTSNPNILLVTHELSRTGAPMVCLDTAKVLINNGYFVTVISLTEGPLLEEFLNIGSPVVIMKELKRLQYLHQETKHFVDVLDLDAFINYFDITFMVTATLYNFVKRYFNTSHKIIWWIHEGSESYNILGNSMPSRVTPNVKVVCGGQYACFQLERNHFNYNPSILNYGVEDDLELHKRKNSKKRKKIKFILAGTIGKRKGQLLLLEAIKNLSMEENEQAEFIFIGDPYKGDFEGLKIQEQLNAYSSHNSNVIVQSSISRKELYKLYEEIDVLVIASIDDPMPVVATENLMLKNICLCSNQTGTSYYLEDKKSGFVFKSGDILELTDKIRYIIKNRDYLDEIKENGRKVYENNFEMSIFEQNILQLISGEVKK